MLLRRVISLQWKPRTFLRLFVGGSALRLSATPVFSRGGLTIMTAVLLGIALDLGVLAWRSPRLHMLGLAGAAGCGVTCTALLGVMFAFVPVFPSYWQGPAFSGAQLSGIPEAKILWAVGFGAIRPRFVAHAFDADYPSSGL